MIISIIGCGESARNWHQVPCDKSIGVNDYYKFGHAANFLVLLNSPSKFKPTRLEIIKACNPEKVYCHNSNWLKYFKNCESPPMQAFIGHIRKGRIYTSKTSPFMAITLAWNLRATDIILWGVDFLDHANYKPGTKELNNEVKRYIELFKLLEKEGIKMWIGNDRTVFKDKLPIYGNSII